MSFLDRFAHGVAPSGARHGAWLAALLLGAGAAALLTVPTLEAVRGHAPAAEPPIAAPSYAASLDRLLEPGDLLFRRGSGLLSRAVLSLEPNAGTYSHVGIVDRRGGEWMVLHIVPPEEGTAGAGRAQAESLDAFLAADRFEAAAVFRARSTEPGKLETALARARDFVRAQRPFDPAFDLATEEALYCTELVWRAFVSAGVDLVDGRFASLRVPLRRGPYILPSTLAESRHLELVTRLDRVEKEES